MTRKTGLQDLHEIRALEVEGEHAGVPRTDSVGDQDDHAEAIYFTDKCAYIL